MKKLPSSASIWEERFFPPIDNQGGIGSCASQSVAYNQFTNAYYRKKAEEGKKVNPKKNPRERFTPRFSYNLSGAGTAWVYELLIDHGALPVSDYAFYKDERGGSQRQRDGKVIAESAGWPTKPGMMKKALYNRLAPGCFDQIWFMKAPYFGRFTTSRKGRALLERIKRAVIDGNAVVTGGYPARWIYSEITNLGRLGVKGEHACVAAAGNAGGGHQVTIVGYDDDIECSFGGVTLKGAFKVANSYGEGWMDEGYTWYMYDAINASSEFPELNDPELYSGPMHLTPADGMKMFPPKLTASNQKLVFDKVGSVKIGEDEYPAYSIFDPESKKYIFTSDESSDRAITLSDEAGAFAFVPYEKLFSLEGANSENYKKEYEGSYWIYASGREGDYHFFDAGTGYASSGRKISLATLNSGRYPMAKSWELDCKQSDHFESRLTIAAGKGEKSSRIWTLDQFCFTDWHTCTVEGYPELFAEIEITTAPRECFSLTMTRRERTEAGLGKKEEFIPALFRYGNAGCHPSYITLPKRPPLPKRLKKGEIIPDFNPYEKYLTFSGIENGEEEKGVFALTYGPLLDLPEGKTIRDYVWGIDVIAKDHGALTVGKMTLRNSKDEKIASIGAQSFRLENGKACFEFNVK